MIGKPNWTEIRDSSTIYSVLIRSQSEMKTLIILDSTICVLLYTVVSGSFACSGLHCIDYGNINLFGLKSIVVLENCLELK